MALLLLLLVGARCFIFDFNYATFPEEGGAIPNISLASCALPAENRLRLTPSTANCAGVGYYHVPVWVRGIDINFEFMIPTAGPTPMEGIVFIMQNSDDGNTAHSDPGAGLGYAERTGETATSIKNSFAIEFDTFANPGIDQPVTTQHVSVHTRGEEGNGARENSDATQHCTVADNMADMTGPEGFSGRIRYEPAFGWETAAEGRLRVWESRRVDPIIDCEISIEKLLKLTDGKAYIGWTAATGDTGNVHDITSWSYSFLGRINANTSVASGDGVEKSTAGEEATFTLRTKDQYGFDFPFNAETVTSIISIGGEDHDVAIVNNDDGTYTGTWSVTKAGTATLTVLMAGDDVAGSPFTAVDVAPGPPVASESIVLGGDLDGGMAGVDLLFHVQSRDQYGNNNRAGTATVSARIVSPPGALEPEVNVIDNTDGTYTGRVKYKTVGSYALNIDLNGSPVGDGKTYELHITHAYISPGHCTAAGNGLRGGEAGGDESFMVTTFDEFENAITSGGDDVEVAMVSGPAGGFINSTSTDRGDGTYLVTVTSNVMGNYSMSVKAGSTQHSVDMDNIKGSPAPFQVNSSRTPDGSLSSVSGDVLGGSPWTAEPAILTIQARDRFNNNLSWDTANPAVSVSGSRGPVPPPQVYLGEGRYESTVMMTTAGSYQASVYVGSADPVQGSPFSITVIPGPLAVPQSFARPKAYTNSLEKALTEQPGEFSVFLTDRWSNLLPYVEGQGNLTVTLAPTSTSTNPAGSEVRITDNADGSFTVRYTVLHAGEHVLAVRVNGGDIKDSPFTIDVNWVGQRMLIIGIAAGVGAASIVIFGALYYRAYRQRKGYVNL